ncbi:WD40 repeat-like protein [Gymnopus androsaceus JB14]|uniref:WD40 repeat-like protein n=1 Tax=Gymnopus androsaceus JB14 TaxID=1447944 RepID=A0A6A4GNL2_9AGAR|nr:WD40 repeat-like protein [Gymnopus androsaceus JB14]
MTDQRLKRIFEDMAKWKDMDKEEMDGIQSCFGHFCKALTDADIYLRKMDATGLIKQTVQSSDNKEEIEKILRSIDDVTQNFHLDINLLHIRLTQAIKGHIEILRLKGLNPSFEALHTQDGRDRCVKETRVHIIEQILSWCKDLSPESPSIYWLNGMAGTGKSTIALTICDMLTKDNKVTRLGASFFCSRQVLNRGKQANVIPTIAHQLALSFPPFGRALLDAKLDAQPIAVKEHSKRMLIEPWKAAISEHVAPIIVVIDALDELEGMEGSQFFQNLMAVMAEETNSVRLKFFITSRQDPKIVEMAQKLPPIVCPRLQDIEDIVVEKDMILYLRNALPELNQDDYSKVARQSAGLFIFAATVVRFILGLFPPSPHMQRYRLELMLGEWPNTDEKPNEGLAVDKLYEEILLGYFKQMAPVDCKRYFKILQTIMCTKVPLMAADIATLCCSPGPLKKEDICTMVSSLHAVLYLLEDHVFTYHKSFVDFMSNVSRLQGNQMRAIFNDYPQDICHYDLTMKCFDVMQNLQFNICKLPSSFQNDSEIKDLSHQIKRYIPEVLQHACRYWSTHLASSMEKNREDIAKKFHTWMETKSIFWIEVMNVLKMVGKCHSMLMEVHKHLKVLPGQRKDIIALANMTKIFGSHSVSESTPHLYISALPVLRSILGEGSTWNTWVTNVPKLTGHVSLNQLVVIPHEDEVNSVAFSPDGTQIVSGSGDESVRIWDASTGKEMHKLEGHTNWVYSVAFSPDGTQIVSGSGDESVRIWDASTGKEMHKLEGHTGWVYSVAFSPDGTQIVSGSGDRSVRIWDASTGKEMHKLEGHTGQVYSVAFSPDGTQIVSGSGDVSVRIWDASTGKEMHKLEGHTGQVYSVAFSPDGTQIVSGSGDRSVRIWDASTGKEMHKLEGHTNWVYSVAFSPDGTQIVSGSGDESVRIWDASTGKEMHKLEGHTGWVYSVAFSPDGTQIVSGSGDRSVRIWDASTGKEMHKLEGHTGWVNSVAFSPDGTQIVSGSGDRSVRIWDASTGKEMHKLEGHTGQVNSVAFSPDGTQIVSGSGDESVRIWDASTGKEMHNLEGHTDSVNSVAFSPDGTQIVSGSGDESVRIWDASTGKEMHNLEGHTDSVNSVAFSPDGTQIASWSPSKCVQIQQADGKSTEIQDSWYFNNDGWIMSSNHSKLMWLPPVMRPYTNQPHCRVISSSGCIDVDFSNTFLGTEWVKCYADF